MITRKAVMSEGRFPYPTATVAQQTTIVGHAADSPVQTSYRGRANLGRIARLSPCVSRSDRGQTECITGDLRVRADGGPELLLIEPCPSCRHQLLPALVGIDESLADDEGDDVFESRSVTAGTHW